MAIYHFSAQMISRSTGRSAVASSAYRAAEKLTDERTGLNHDYTRKSGVEYTEILAPTDSPEWVKDRAALWNEVEKKERRKDSQLSREINVALPKELTKDQQIELIKEFTYETFITKGMIADIAIHDNGKGNPHAHIMLTTREITKDVFGKKNRDWNNKELLQQWREDWSKYANKSLERAGIQERIDHRTLEEQGIDKIPQIHVGVHASAMEKRGIETERGNLNKEIKDFNESKLVELQKYKELKVRDEQLKAKEEEQYKNLTPKEISNLKQAYKLLEEPVNRRNSLDKLEVLKDFRKAENSELVALTVRENEIKSKISKIQSNLETLKRNEEQFRVMEKNIFGQYKEKARAKTIKNNIKHYKLILGTGAADIYLYENDLKKLSSKKNEIKLRINGIENKMDILNKGVKALENKELREFYNHYKNQLYQGKYWNYADMQAIKRVNKEYGRTLTIKEIYDSYKNHEERIGVINKELKGIETTREKLERTKVAVETITKNEKVAIKFENKFLGKDRYQEKHRYEKQRYDNALKVLKQCGVENTVDFIMKERDFNNTLNDVKPKLLNEKEILDDKFSLLESAAKSIVRVIQKDKEEKRIEQNKQKSKTMTKNKSMGMER